MIGPMRSARSLALHPAARAASEAQAAGPAMAVLAALLLRIAAMVRGAGAVYVLVQVAIWHAFYQASPARLWGPVVAVGWAAAAIWYLHGRRPPSPLACLDWAVYAMLALAAGGCVPVAIRGQAAEWLFIAVASGLIVQVWFSPPRLSMPLSLASGLAFWGGIVLTPGSHTARGARAASAVLLFAVVAAHWCGRRLLYGRASRADSALAMADQDARGQFVVLSRAVERREHDRLLHDTVLNTLTAVARPGPAAGIISRCRHDLARLECALSEPAGPAVAPRRPVAELVAGLHAVAGEMRARGLSVQLHTEPGPAGPGDRGHRAGRPGGAGQRGRARRDGRGLGHGPPAGSGGRRNGRRGDRARRGGRVRPGPARAGPAGRAAVHHRTDHRLRWLGRGALRAGSGHAGPAVLAGPARTGAAARAGRPAGRPVLTGDRIRPARNKTVLARRAATASGAVAVGTESAAPLFLGALAVILPVGMLVQVLATTGSYRQPLAAVAVWLGILLAAGWLVPRALARGLSRPEAVLAIAVAVAAVTAIGLDRRVHMAAGSVDWAILGTVWLLAMVALSRSAWLWAPGAALVFAAHAFLVVNLLGATALGLARVAAGGYAMGVVLAIFAALRPTLRTHSEIAVRRAELASRSAAERAAVAAIHADRADRMALLEAEALPLLRGMAGGSLDPADPSVRRKCAEHATTLRQALVHRTGRAGGVLAALGPALGMARARAMPVEIQVVGDPGPPDRAVAQATVAALRRVLQALPPQPVILTVLSAGDEVGLYLTFRRAPGGHVLARGSLAGLGRPVPAAAAWRATLDAEGAGPGCLEVSWRKGPG